MTLTTFQEFILVLLSITSCFSANELKIVNTRNGPVQGIETVFNGVKITQFFGVPFAEPPIGKLRFKKPEPLKKQWTEALDATQPKVACMQNLMSALNVNMSEDCLYLNIWTPNLVPSSKPKAVLFWIYGGYFTTGHIDRDEYNGIAVAAVGDVIVVAPNYRVDAFGFLYACNSEAPGNVGFHDQIIALKWVQENIASFGGDPNQVTIVGESAGSVSVGAHIISSLSRKYFRRAIMQSGSPLKFQGLHKKDVTPENSLKKSKTMAANLGCTGSEWIQCLKQVDVNSILDWIRNNGSFFPLYTNSKDGFFPQHQTPAEALQSGNFKQDVQLLIGTVANEGSSYLKNELPDYFNRENQKLIDKQLAKELIKKLINYSSIDSEVVAEFYTDPVYHENRNELRKSVAYSFGDFRVVCPVYYFSKQIALHSSRSNVYSFQFRHKPKVGIAKNCVDWMGVCHADDIIFTFGHPIRFPNKYAIEDYYFSLLTINIWTSFVKTGNPLPKNYFNLPGFTQDIKWPQFRTSASVGDRIVPNYMILHPKYFGNKVYYPYQSNCEGVWRPYFDN